jgi:hypothetical protein
MMTRLLNWLGWYEWWVVGFSGVDGTGWYECHPGDCKKAAELVLLWGDRPKVKAYTRWLRVKP